MASLFDIGKSGLTAYRQALTVTGQNIANIDTEGYKRRAAGMEEVTAGRSSATGLQNQTGIGVRVTDVRRSFDEYLLNKARSATASAESASAFHENIRYLEDLLLPGEANLGNTIGGFFSSLQEIVTSPADLAPRVVAMEQAKMMANKFNEVAMLVDETKAGLVSQLTQQTDAVNILSSELAAVNQQIAATGTARPNNALLDSRDAMIDRISEYVAVTVELSATGVAKLTLGESGNGPAIVNGNKSQKIGVDPQDRSIAFIVAPGAANLVTSQVVNGSLNGVAEAYETASIAMSEIDELAFTLVRDMNAIHQQGLDLEGQPGKALFQDIDINLSPNPTNVGPVMAEAEILDPSQLQADVLTLSYDAEANLWNARGVDGGVIASGRTSITLPGMKIHFIGAAENYDQFTLDPIRGSASGVKFALSRPHDFAATSPLLVSADARNASDAQIDAQLQESYRDSGLPSIVDVMTNGASAITATTFLSGGPATIVPANVSSIDLFSLVQQATVRFGVGDKDLSKIGSLTLSYTGQDDDGNAVTREATFLLEQSNFNNDTEGWSDLRHVANLLNQGALKGTVSGSGDVVALSDIGGFASGEAGNLTISLSEEDIIRANIGLADGRQFDGVVSGRIDEASSIQVFTREGRYIAGAPPTADQLERWKTEIATNPAFMEGAEYRDDYLNLSGEQGYLGVEITRGVGASEILLEKTVDATTSAIKFTALDGLDTNELSPDGNSASARTSFYSATFGTLSASIDAADIPSATGSDVAVAMLDKLRSTAPIAQLDGRVALLEDVSFTLTDVNLTADDIHQAGSTAVSYRGAIYQFTSKNDVITVSGGPSGIKDLALDSETGQITGQIVKLPAEGDAVSLSFEGQSYQLHMRGGEVLVTGGEPGRLEAYYDQNSRLKIVSTSGTISRSDIRVATNAEVSGNKDAAQRFGLMEDDLEGTSYFSNQAWIGVRFKNGGVGADGGETLSIELAGSDGADTLNFVTGALDPSDEAEIATKIKEVFDALPDKKGYEATFSNGAVWFTRDDGKNFSFKSSETETDGTSSITLQANLWPAGYDDLTSGTATALTTEGFTYTEPDFELSRSGDMIIATALNDTAPPDVSGTAKSLVGERITITNLPGEELIIAVGANGAKKLAAQFDLLPEGAPTLRPDISIEVVDDENNIVEFIDTATGTSMATRTLDEEGRAAALDILAKLNGVVAAGDQFHIANNAEGVGDARAMNDLASLQTGEGRDDGRGGFQAMFNVMVAKVGSMVQSGELAVQATAALRDASVEAESAFSGVNLDTEASNLIEQQQAYQASARVLSTARELFETLLQTL